MPAESSAIRCLLYGDDRFLQHRTGGHPESVWRLMSLYDRFFPEQLSQSDDIGSWKVSEPHFALSESVERRWRAVPEIPTLANLPAVSTLHDPKYLHRLEQFAAHGGGSWDADTVVSPDSYEIALLASATALHATDAVLTGDVSQALCLLRPPGHHAVRADAMGFCLVNHIAVAAQHALQKHDLSRVLIVDWDVHHGNGTQDLFYSSDQVWFFSIHRFPFYPGTGSRDETGAGPGTGATCNVPVEFGLSREEYLQLFERELTAFAQKCQPELICLSAGFDAHTRDPIGSLGLETEDFTHLTQIVQHLAKTHCQGRLLSLLEGGYDLTALTDSVTAHLKQLTNKS